jgi:hypothetical protein
MPEKVGEGRPKVIVTNERRRCRIIRWIDAKLVFDGFGSRRVCVGEDLVVEKIVVPKEMIRDGFEMIHPEFVFAGSIGAFCDGRIV